MDSNHEDKRLFLLDAMALVYRAYYAFIRNPRYNSKGQNTSAAFGFTNTLNDLLQKEKPTHIAVVFDTHAPTERHTVFQDYKANRQATPEDIISNVPIIKEIIKGFNIPVLELDGYEADDIIGTLAKKAEKQGYTTYMVTPDKDFGQLVSDHIFMYKPSNKGNGFETMGVPEILAKWGIKDVSHVIDILGLWGDAVDNIPGIPSVGEKTAAKLINQYESIENIIKNAADIKGKLGENIKQYAEQGLLSKRLATIILDVPIEFDEKDLLYEEADKKKLTTLFAELEFKTLGKRILGEEFNITDSNGTGQMNLFSNGEEKTDSKAAKISDALGNSLANTKHDYQLIDTADKRKKLIRELNKQKVFCFDTETTGLDPINAEIVGLSIAYKPQEAYYIPCPAHQKEATAILEEFKPLFENEKIEKIAQNIKYDLLILKRYGIDIKGKMYDTMLAHYVAEPEMRHNMDAMAEMYLNYTPMSIEELIGKKGKDQGNMRDVAFEKIKEYAAEDADITLQLKIALDPLVKERKVEKVLNDIEIPLVPVLASMEYEGVAINSKFLNEYSIELEKQSKQIEGEIYKEAGQEFNIASPKQLGVVLFENMKITDKAKKTKTGQYATNEEVLAKLANEHDIVKKILDYRELNKLKSTYVDALPKLVNPKTGRIHTDFNQAVAATGRLSSMNPNLQNIPIRTERGREIRKAFIPRNKDYVLLSADYSQIELRIIAAISEDVGMIDAFTQGQDIHATTASKVYGVDLKEVTPDMRRNAKTVNFGIIYGISAFGLSERIGVSRTEAKELIENYFDKYPNIKKYMDNTIELAKKNGYVETIMGRRRYLRDINSANAVVRGYSERNAINTRIQGSAADMIKLAMINIHKEFEKRNLKTKMTLQVHDELVFDAHKDEVETIKPIIEEKMRTAMELKVPMVVEMGTGKNWLEAH